MSADSTRVSGVNRALNVVRPSAPSSVNCPSAAVEPNRACRAASAPRICRGISGSPSTSMPIVYRYVRVFGHGSGCPGTTGCGVDIRRQWASQLAALFQRNKSSPARALTGRLDAVPHRPTLLQIAQFPSSSAETASTQPVNGHDLTRDHRGEGMSFDGLDRRYRRGYGLQLGHRQGEVAVGHSFR
jgi:hypothetical protein